MSKQKVNIHWFRRDLRLHDNHALFSALNDEHPVQPIFIFDTNILDKLSDKKDARVSFIHEELVHINRQLKTIGASLDVRYGDPIEVWKQLVKDYEISKVYANRDYEPYAINRDKEVYEFLAGKDITFIGRKDHVIFEKNEIVKADGKPYTVYSPYARKWKEHFSEEQEKHYHSENLNNWYQRTAFEVLALSEMGFEPTDIKFPERDINKNIIRNYHKTRDIPEKRGTSRLSVHLRFGTIGIRELVRESRLLNEKYLNELIWRDFYASILWHFPHVVEHNFSRKYDGVQWRNNEEEFEKWCQGKTGYPIVDAGMRELNATGFMHNRVRMIVASFLTKHLLIDWRWGEAYFAQKLLDFELASNNGGWQWASGTGVDAAPYFRVFNPYLQTEKFDPKLDYIKKWVPELNSTDYPKPLVDHKFARQRAIDTYKDGLAAMVSVE